MGRKPQPLNIAVDGVQPAFLQLPEITQSEQHPHITRIEGEGLFKARDRAIQLPRFGVGNA